MISVHECLQINSLAWPSWTASNFCFSQKQAEQCPQTLLKEKGTFTVSDRSSGKAEEEMPEEVNELRRFLWEGKGREGK